MIHNETKLDMKKGARLPLSLFFKAICIFIFFILSGCATPPKAPIYIASGKILNNGNILRVWRKDSATGIPEKVQFIINSGIGVHSALEKLNYTYEQGKLAHLVALQYIKDDNEIETVLHFNIAGQVIFKQKLTANLASSPSSQSITALIVQQKKLLSLSNQLKQDHLNLYQGLYTQNGTVLNCQTIDQHLTEKLIGVAWLIKTNWLPFSDKKNPLLSESKNICLDQPKWFIVQSSQSHFNHNVTVNKNV